MQALGEYEERAKPSRPLFRVMADSGFGFLTSILILVSIVVFAEKYFLGARFLEILYISQLDISNAGDLTLWHGCLERLSAYHEILPEIRQGQIWRLVTPIFIHLTFPHILFNLVCLRDLGSVIESRLSSLRLLLLVVVIAAICNLAGYLIAGGGFAGMSGVVYGLAAYIWVRAKFDPSTRLYLNPITLGILLIWFFVCLIGILGPMINVAHLAGLVAGSSWGSLVTLIHRWKPAPRKLQTA